MEYAIEMDNQINKIARDAEFLVNQMGLHKVEAIEMAAQKINFVLDQFLFETIYYSI